MEWKAEAFLAFKRFLVVVSSFFLVYMMCTMLFLFWFLLFSFYLSFLSFSFVPSSFFKLSFFKFSLPFVLLISL